MEGRRFIESIRLDRILSFGPNEEAFELEPLNVLIGPNASGKSNLIEALSILHAAPRDLQAPTREGGGVREWMWKGELDPQFATVEATLPFLNSFERKMRPIRYRLAFNETGGRFLLHGEAVESKEPLCAGEDKPHIYFLNRSEFKHALVEVADPPGNIDNQKQLRREEIESNNSILAQRKDPLSYPEISYLARAFEQMRFYRGWNFGRQAPVRLPQRTDGRQNFLLEDASNLALVLNDMMNRPGLKGQLLEHMRNFYPLIEDINTGIIGGTVQVYFHEKGLHEAIPATRLSDGSLQYLCLLAVLCHPGPPTVICIEEPELGLHPDIIPEVGKLLIEASKRSQIFVTTHSDILVDSLSEVPEAVVVCEKVDGATQLRRLDGESLREWLKDYSLGELWTSGRFGGNRW